MREISFKWGGSDIRLAPTMLLLQRVASEIRQVTSGEETTVSMAYKCVNGGVEPLFLLIPLRAFLQEALGVDRCPSDEEIMTHALSNVSDMIGFRLAYASAVLPNVDLGKGPAAPSGPGEGAKAEKKAGPKKKSTSKPST